MKEFERIHIYSPSLHQNLYQKLIRCFNNYTLLNIIPKVLNEEYIDLVIDEIVSDKDFKKSDIEIETYESIDKLKFPQDYNDGVIFILDDINEKKTDPRLQAMFERCRQNTSPIFMIKQDHYELPKRTFRANGNTHHIFEPNNFRDFQSLCQH